MSVRVLVGHVLARLADLPDESVHCVVTSPPYYGLRSYGTAPQVWGGDPNCRHEWGNSAGKLRSKTDTGNVRSARDWNQFEASNGNFCHCGAWRGDLGLEPTPELFIAHMVEVFREVRRVLRRDGTLWLNIGDGYFGTGKGPTPPTGFHGAAGVPYPTKGVYSLPGYKSKDLMMIPAQLALALRADGWWLRSEIVWAKKAPMPESCTDRPTCAHEKVFLFAKGQWKSRVIKFSDLHGQRVHLGKHLGSDPSYPRGVQICVSLARAIFDRAQSEQGFGLPPFYAEEWQQCDGHGDSDFVSSLPPQARAAIWAARFCGGNATAEEFLHEIDRLPIALGNSGDFLISRVAPERLDTPAIDGDRKRTITVHDAGQVSEIDFAHEQIVYRTSTTCKYFYDAEAVKEESITNDPRKPYTSAGAKNGPQASPDYVWHSGERRKGDDFSSRNMRNVWHLGPEPFPEAHFATFVSEIPRRAILAGTSAKGVCPKCAAPWVRQTKTEFVKLADRRPTRKAVQPGAQMADINSNNVMGYNDTQTIGWRPSCSCDADGKYTDPIPATCLDPFLGSGTTAMVADQLGRHCIGIELAPSYAAMSERRVRADAGMFAQIAAE
jgi:DNA modification methylase